MTIKKQNVVKARSCEEEAVCVLCIYFWWKRSLLNFISYITYFGARNQLEHALRHSRIFI